MNQRVLSKAERSRALRYKRPALSSMGYEVIDAELEEMGEACLDVRYFLDSDKGGDLLDSVLGDDEESWEFRMAFCDLSAKIDQLRDALYENLNDREEFDDCTVALIGNRYDLVGYDGYEEDYYSLTSYERELAETEAGKRLMRKTKAEMISTIGQCFGALLAYYDIRQQYDYLKATMDIIRDENASLLNSIKAIDSAYERAVDSGPYTKESYEFEELIKALPDILWIQ